MEKITVRYEFTNPNSFARDRSEIITLDPKSPIGQMFSIAGTDQITVRRTSGDIRTYTRFS